MSADTPRNVVTTAILRLAKGGRDVPTKIQRWGNSQGIRVPKSVLADARLQVGDVVDVRAVDGTLVVTRARSRRGRASLEDLVAALSEAGPHGETDWGRPEGDEV
jgi:antitoxin MazE